MLERVGNEQEDKQVKKDKIVERHVHDETVRIVEDGGGQERSKFAEK